jgi:hypothetical protein
MADFGSLLRSAARRAGRTVGAAKRQYDGAKIEGSVPADENGRARIVCRRAAERRAVALEDGVPTCYEASNPDCESCVADLADGSIETW